MKNSIFIKNLITSIFITILLLYFMVKTTSPKIIFIPFLFCSIMMVGKNLALIFEKKKLAMILSKLFIVGFLLFWFGVLVVAGYICVRDRNYTMMAFSLPFWLVGIYLIKNKLLNIKGKNNSPKLLLGLPFGIIISALLVLVAIVSGVIILGFGIMQSDMGMIFTGAFFTFGAFTFVLAALTMKGCFDKFRIDVLGLYIGVIFVVIGIGIIAMIFQQAFGFWILIPVMMIVAGVLQIVKCLKNR